MALCWAMALMVVSSRAATWYVATNSPTDGPGTAWSNAFHTIQDGVEAAFADDTVLVADGMYNTGMREMPGGSSFTRVVITNDITVRSVNGPEATFIIGAEAPGGGNGTGAVRGVYMSDGLLSGFTVTNGHTYAYLFDFNDLCGGGIYFAGVDAVVTNCVITGNSAFEFGGGIGGYYGGTVDNCMIVGNTAYDGGGSWFNGVMNNCMIVGNTAGSDGGGSTSDTLNNCIVLNNTAKYGGGCKYGRLNNCTVSGNTADYGGGSYSSWLSNCIVWGNSATVSGDNWESDQYNHGTFVYSCTTPMPTNGEHNITNNPQFVNADSDNYRLRYGSPCIDAGINAYIVGSTDLDGNPRIINGTVDMGAYEYDPSMYDSDDDAFTDDEEMIADTDPLDADSCFHVLVISNGPPTLSFASSSNRWYTMEGCSNLFDGAWIEITGSGPRSGTGGTDWMMDTNIPPQGPFYRLNVALP